MTIHYKSERVSQYSPGSRSLSFSYRTQPRSACSRRMRGNIKYNQHGWYGLFLSVVLTWLWQPPPSTVHSESSLVARASTPFCCFSKNRELFYRQRTMLEAIQSNLYTGLLLFPRLVWSSLPHWGGVYSVALLVLRVQLCSSGEKLTLGLVLIWLLNYSNVYGGEQL